VWSESTLEACVASIAAVCADIPLVPMNPKHQAAASVTRH
jgi:hypothetical protein